MNKSVSLLCLSFVIIIVAYQSFKNENKSLSVIRYCHNFPLSSWAYCGIPEYCNIYDQYHVISKLIALFSTFHTHKNKIGIGNNV